jgi:hypothetical protein
MRDRLRSGLISALVLVISLGAAAEFFSFLYLRHVVRLNWSPAYLAAATEHRRIGAWLTETAEWGAWHLPHATARQESACFSVALQANSYGARDRERAMDGPGTNRVVVLGDSFAEGFGVEEEQRLTNILERRLGVEFLNFGTALDFGPLQYQILYDRLAAKFAHDRVMIMFLPDNDFTDNDAEYWKAKRGRDFLRRHRPYYQKTADGLYQPFYPPKLPGGEVDAQPAWYQGWPAGIERWISRNLWTYRAGDYVAGLFGGGNLRSGYFDFTPEQLDAVLWSFGEIKRRAGPRAVTIVVIPRLTDFRRAARAGANKLIPRLQEFGAANGITIVDLMEPMRRIEPNAARFFFACDGHWSEAGNAAAAAALLSQARP